MLKGISVYPGTSEVLQKTDNHVDLNLNTVTYFKPVFFLSRKANVPCQNWVFLQSMFVKNNYSAGPKTICTDAEFSEITEKKEICLFSKYCET